MASALNNLIAPDAYSPASQLSCPNAARVRLMVNNQSIYWRRGQQGPAAGGINWSEQEDFVVPGLYSFDESCDAIQIRAAIPAAQLPAGAKQAQVTVSTRTLTELGPGA